MKSIEQIFQKDITAYPFRTIIDNLTDDQIKDCIIEYANQYKRTLNIKEELIPKGIYCDNCPYFSYVSLYDDIGEIRFPFCIYLGCGSMPNSGWNNNEFERLQALLHLTDDELWNHVDGTDKSGLLALDLLWDGCKECGINDEIDEKDLM